MPAEIAVKVIWRALFLIVNFFGFTLFFSQSLDVSPKILYYLGETIWR